MALAAGTRPWRVLHIEDNPADAELVSAVLRAQGLSLEIVRAECPESVLDALARGVDVVLSDYSLPTLDGLEALKLVRTQAPDLPFILLSGFVGEMRAVEVMRAGAQDYVLKDNITRLGEVLRREVLESRRRRSDRLAQDRHQGLFQTDAVGVFELDVSGVPRWPLDGEEAADPWVSPLVQVDLLQRLKVVRANGEGLRQLGIDHPQDFAAATGRFRGLRQALAKSLVTGGELRLECSGSTEAGEPRRLWMSAREPSPLGSLVLIAVDVTWRGELEARVIAAQRVEALGRLAGGLAHDFNNLLTVMLTHAALVEQAVEENEAAREDLGVMVGAMRSAALLVADLRTFSRRQAVVPVRVDLNQQVARIARSLDALLGASVDVVQELEPDIGACVIDPVALEQVLLNLCINARDAMPGGGRLVVGTRRRELRSPPESDPELLPGQYLELRVSDTGAGMSLDIQTRCFEPFFTTKDEGKGTGLGLASCYGIVKQAHGCVLVESQPGEGTTFRVLLPRVGD